MILSLIPSLLSFLIGAAALCLIFENKQKPTPLLYISLSMGLGLGISAYIILLQLLIFSQVYRPLIITEHLLILALLCWQSKSQLRAINIKSYFSITTLKKFLPLIFLLIASIPLCLRASALPHGGWDAWTVWNFKAKMIFLGQENWTNIFNPLLWRSSPHYPLLLPLVNVWNWIGAATPTKNGPILTGIIFTFIYVGLCFSALKNIIPNLLRYLYALTLLTLPIFLTYATSQYCDLVLGFYLSASLICLWQAREKNCGSFSLLAGLFCGMLSFTKPEGHVAALLILCCAIPYLFLKNQNIQKKKMISPFFLGAALTYLPALIYYIFIAPKNITIANGLLTATDMTGLLRIKTILKFYLLELSQIKWQGLWLLSFVILIAHNKKSSQPDFIIFPIFLFCYQAIIIAYYFINTHFELSWWLGVTLSRILCSLLPLVLFWIFLISGTTKKANE